MRAFSSSLLALSVLLLSLATPSCATIGRRSGGMSHLKELASRAIVVPPTNGSRSTTGAGTFEQPIDHDNPTFGTFHQRYWYDTRYWNGPGSPVVLSTVGEAAAGQFFQGYLSNASMAGLQAQNLGAMMISIEHRYWGKSIPFRQLTTENLQFLTVEQAMSDFTRFAKLVQLPFDPDTSGSAAPVPSNVTTGGNLTSSGPTNSSAANVPWVFYGTSYAGNLGAWMATVMPGTFWAYHSTSAPVQVVYDFGSYYNPIQNGMPQNCSADLSRIVEHVDQVIDEGNATAIQDLQAMFGMENLTHTDDFANALSDPLNLWQQENFLSGYSEFYQMCDTIEGVRQAADGTPSANSSSVPVPNATAPGAEGLGLDKALENFATYYKKEYLPGNCASYNVSEWNDTMSVQCFDTYDTASAFYTDKDPDSTVNQELGVQWLWMQCNQPMMWYKTAMLPGGLNLVSKLKTAEYYQRQCDLAFMKFGNTTYSSNGRPEEAANEMNNLTSGWDISNTSRLLFVNGEFDPWRSGSVSSLERPGGPVANTSAMPIFLVPGAHHNADLSTGAGNENPGLRDVQNAAVDQMKQWVAEFYTSKGQQPPFQVPDRFNVTQAHGSGAQSSRASRPAGLSLKAGYGGLGLAVAVACMVMW